MLLSFIKNDQDVPCWSTIAKSKLWPKVYQFSKNTNFKSEKLWIHQLFYKLPINFEKFLKIKAKCFLKSMNPSKLPVFAEKIHAFTNISRKSVSFHMWIPKPCQCLKKCTKSRPLHENGLNLYHGLNCAFRWEHCMAVDGRKDNFPQLCVKQRSIHPDKAIPMDPTLAVLEGR